MQAFGAAVLSLCVAVSGAFAQIVDRQVVDTGTRNTRLGRPMSTPRSAGEMSGMSGMQGMPGMKDTTGVSSGKEMPGMQGMKGVPSSPDSSMESMVELQTRMIAMLELHVRMMADPDIRMRVMNDAELRSLADRASAPLAHGRAGQMEMPMSDSSHARLPGAAGMTGMTGMTHASDTSAKPHGRKKVRPRATTPTKKPSTSTKGAGMTGMDMSQTTAQPKRATTSNAAEKPAAKPPAKPAAPAKPTEKKSPPMPPMPGMDHSKMPGMGKP
jgi:hypothetical protein